MIYALGAFDGFHLGHRQLLKTAAMRAEKIKTAWGVITFDGHPQQLFNKENFRLLFTAEERDILTKYMEIPEIVKIPFTHAFAELTPVEFISMIAAHRIINGLVVGENFLFGRGRSGNTGVLAEICSQKNWSLDIVESYKLRGNTVSSTSIRDCILRGKMEQASEMLGYPFIISGKVVTGDSRGHGFGYPTANIMLKSGKIYPARGSYAALVFIAGEWMSAAVNIGYNPTFEGTRAMRCEAHIINYSGNLYGKNITIFLIKRNREEIKFSGIEQLKAQLDKDMRQTHVVSRSYLAQKLAALKKFEPLLL